MEYENCFWMNWRELNMNKFTKTNLLLLLTFMMILLAGCGGGNGYLDKLGKLEGLWVDRTTGEAFRLTKEGLFQRGRLDDGKDVFTIDEEYAYLIDNHELNVYSMDCTDKSFEDWSRMSFYYKVEAFILTPPKGYTEHKNPYTVESNSIQTFRIDLSQVKKHLRGIKTDGLCGITPGAPTNKEDQVAPVFTSTFTPTATPEPTATPTPIPEYTINGLCKSLSGGTTSGMLYTAPMVMYFDNDFMYAGQEGMSVEDIKAMASQSVWNGGAPYKVVGNTISFALPDGTSIDVQRNGNRFTFNNDEYECPEGSIQLK